MSSDTDAGVRLTAMVDGMVQGVGFRWWTRRRALELGLVGEVRNLPDGRVSVIAEGDQRACDALLAALGGRDAPGRVDSVVANWGAARGEWSGFVGA